MGSGTQNAVLADVAAMRVIADRVDASAQLLESAARINLSRLRFGGATAGRAHTGRGDAMRAALNRLAGEVSQWARASSEIAVALRVAADRYADAEARSVSRIG